MYKPGRSYRKEHLAKGKARKGKMYERSSRNSELVPESRAQILKYIKDQNKALRYFIKETTELEANKENVEFESVSLHVENDEQELTLLDSDEEDAQDTEMVALTEWQI